MTARNFNNLTKRARMHLQIAQQRAGQQPPKDYVIKYSARTGLREKGRLLTDGRPRKPGKITLPEVWK
jgi:hypothetical protein